MKILWTYIEKQKWCEETKFIAASLILGILSALVGAAVWLFIRNWALSAGEWIICFAGYPMVASWITVYLYFCNHGFNENEKKSLTAF